MRKRADAQACRLAAAWSEDAAWTAGGSRPYCRPRCLRRANRKLTGSRCRINGGKSTGAPKGNNNAYHLSNFPWTALWLFLKGNTRGLKAKAVAYICTSSAANVGAEKDSEKRQRQAIAAFAKRAGLELVGEFTDAAVSGADHIETRPGFTAMLAYIASNGARTIIVETASRFARDLMVQEVGFAKLQALGIKLVAADNPHSFLDDTPTSKLIRQILGAVSEFDKAMVVAKLKGARERKRVITGKKVEGRKSHAELRPELVALVRQLRRKRPKGGQRSLREISAELAARGIMNERGKPFSAASINSMLSK
jgi:DNA invertase Pin-like site-specific DNA recombinase